MRTIFFQTYNLSLVDIQKLLLLLKQVLAKHSKQTISIEIKEVKNA